MKKTILGIVILALVVIAIVLSQIYAHSVINDFSTLAAETLNCVRSGEFDTAKEDINNLIEMYNEKSDVLATFILHDKLDNIDSQLYRVAAYIDAKESSEASSMLLGIMKELETMEANEKFALENIL